METLAIFAAEFDESLQGCFVFDPLRHNAQGQAVRHFDNGSDDAGVIRIDGHAPDEGLIYFQAVHFKIFQITQIGIASAEIIDRQAQAQCAQTTHCGETDLRERRCPRGGEGMWMVGSKSVRR